MNKLNSSNIDSTGVYGTRMDKMTNGIFYVTVREDYEKARQDYFPYIAAAYTAIAKNFSKSKPYPVVPYISLHQRFNIVKPRFK